MGIGTGEGRRRRLAVNEPTPTQFGYTMWTSTDFFYRAIQAISLNVFFYAKNTNNILTNELLEICHEVEKGIKDFPFYHNHSLVYREQNEQLEALFQENQLYLEASPGSFLNYIYPQTLTVGGFSTYIYNGNGDRLTLIGDIENTIRTLNRADDQDITEFFDFSFNFVNVTSKYLAAIYPFGYQNSSETKDELGAWVASYRTDFFDKLGSSVTDRIGIAVIDSKGYIFNDELYYYLARDLNLAIWSIIVIYIVVYLYCRSFYITTLGLLGVMASFLGAFASYYIIWGETFSIVNMVAVWVILGIGCDDICVFISSYRRAPLESVNGQVIPNHLRLSFAYREAGSAMFVTSFTTSCSFFSLCLSTINPLPQFGFFLGILVLINFYLVMTWFPCILQSYVWWVMFTMKHGCFIPGCTKWLSVAVPLPEQYDISQDKRGLDKQKSMIVVKRSSSKNNALLPMGAGGNSVEHTPIAEADINGQTPLYGRQLSRQGSSKFAVPGGATSPSSESIGGSGDINGSPMPGHTNAPSQLVRQLTRKLDKNNAGGDGFSAETQFGDCTNLYFVIMRRYESNISW